MSTKLNIIRIPESELKSKKTQYIRQMAVSLANAYESGLITRKQAIRQFRMIIKNTMVAPVQTSGSFFQDNYRGK